MRVSTEAIHQSLYVQSRGALRRDLARCLRTGRAVRRPCRKPGQRKNRIPNMINISERPAEGTDRAVPGHWEGDLIIAKRNLTAIATLVERTTGYTMLVHLPDGYKAEQVRERLGREDPDAARAAARVADVRSGARDARVKARQRRGRHRHLLLRSTCAVAARDQREHQRAAAPVLSERQRPVRSQRHRPRVGRHRTQRPPRKRLRYAKPIEEIAPLPLH
jgi:hypothetical protein